VLVMVIAVGVDKRTTRCIYCEVQCSAV